MLWHCLIESLNTEKCCGIGLSESRNTEECCCIGLCESRSTKPSSSIRFNETPVRVPEECEARMKC
jgi:hypothetical protein